MAILVKVNGNHLLAQAYFLMCVLVCSFLNWSSPFLNQRVLRRPMLAWVVWTFAKVRCEFNDVATRQKDKQYTEMVYVFSEVGYAEWDGCNLW